MTMIRLLPLPSLTSFCGFSIGRLASPSPRRWPGAPGPGLALDAFPFGMGSTPGRSLDNSVVTWSHNQSDSRCLEAPPHSCKYGTGVPPLQPTGRPSNAQAERRGPAPIPATGAGRPTPPPRPKTPAAVPQEAKRRQHSCSHLFPKDRQRGVQRALPGLSACRGEPRRAVLTPSGRQPLRAGPLPWGQERARSSPRTPQTLARPPVP